MSYVPNREEAEKLFFEYNKSDSLLKHALQVEAVMRHFAKLYGEDEEKWGVIGFLHDLDYEMYPDEHCQHTGRILEENGYPEEYIRAILSHGYGMVSDVEPVLQMEKVLYAIDELTGLINAACLLRPSQSVLDLSVKSLNKKWKDKKFAAGVNREVILKGIEMLGMEKNDLIQETINGMCEHAELIGLKGNL